MNNNRAFVVNKIQYVFTFLLLCFSNIAFSQNYIEPYSVYDPEILDSYKVIYKNVKLGSEYSPVNGNENFSVNDIDIPGNFAIPVSLTRLVPQSDTDSGGPVGWTWDIPFIKAHYLRNVSGGSGRVVTTETGWRAGFNCTGTADYAFVDLREKSFRYFKHMYWRGIELNIPEKTNENFVTSTDGTRITKSNYKIIGCTSAYNLDNGVAQEGIRVKGPDGTIYEFNNIKSYDSDELLGSQNQWRPIRKYTKLLRVTKIIDRFGNYVDYRYNTNNELEVIESSDGRRIDIVYESYFDSTGKLLGYRPTQASANGKIWRYTYLPVYGGSLHRVTLPDNTYWEYDAELMKLNANSFSAKFDKLSSVQYADTLASTCQKSSMILRNLTTAIKVPSGVIISYQFSTTYHPRSQVEPEFYTRADPGYYGTDYFPNNESCTINYSLRKKTLSAPGIQNQIWNYSYSENVGSFTNASLNSLMTGTKEISVPSWGLPAAINANRANYRTVTISSPDSVTVHYIDTKFQSVSESMVVATDYLSANGNELLRREIHNFAAGAEKTGSHWFINEPDNYEGPSEKSLNLIQTQYQVNKIGTTTYDYDIYGAVDTYQQTFSGYDKYGLYRRVDHENTLNSSGSLSNVKIECLDYIIDTNLWLIGLPWKSGIQTSSGGTCNYIDEIVYHSASVGNTLYKDLYLPYERKKFGTWLTRYTHYYTSQSVWGSPGNLDKLELNQPLLKSDGMYDSQNRYQVYRQWKRGVAQEVQVPTRYSHQSMISMYRIVNADGLPERVSDLNGNEVRYGYDASGWLTSVDFPGSLLDLSISWSKDTVNGYQRVASRCQLSADKTYCSTSPKFKTVTNFDGLMRVINSTDIDVDASISRAKNYRYDSRHLVTFDSLPSTSTAETRGTISTFDGLGRLKQVQTPNYAITSFQFYKGNKTRTLDPKNFATTTAYLAYGAPEKEMPVRIESPESITTVNNVNAYGEVTSMQQTGPGKNGVGTLSLTEYRAYNSLHQLCKVSRPDSGVSDVLYNNLGQITARSNGTLFNASTVSQCSSPSSYQQYSNYDNLGALYKTTYADASPALTYTRNNNGWVTTLQAGSVSQNFTYMPWGAVDAETISFPGVTRSIDREFDSLGNISSLTYPDGDVVSFNPNAFGNPRQASRNASVRPAYTYANSAAYYPTGNIDYFYYGNGITHKTTLNSVMQPERVRDYGTSFTALDYVYTYDTMAKVSSITDQLSPSYSITNFNYDGRGRLTSTTAKNGIGSSTMKYDGLDNITSYISKNSNLDYVYNTSTNRLQSVSGSGTAAKNYSFSYTNGGEVSNNGSRAFTWNYAGQLTASGSASYLYDGFNRRVKQTDSQGTSYSFYTQSGQLIYQYTPRGHVNYIYLGNKLIAKDGSFNDNAGKLHYKPFGSTIESTPNDLGFTGHKFDKDSGLVYAQARYYDPVIGRFYSPDPIGSADQFNVYAYVGNDPVNATDPTGMYGYYPGLAELTQRVDGTVGKGIRNVASTVADFIPGVGDVKGVADAIVNPSTANAVAAIAGVVPVIGDAATIIKGTAQMTKKGGEATSHASTSERIANEMVESGEYTSVHLNQTVTTITEGAQNSRVRPDVAGVRVDNQKVDVVEVLSPGQTASQMETKINNALGSSCNGINCVDQD